MALRRENTASHVLPCPISRLSEECKARIIDFLPAKDVKNLRLTSQEWGGVCVPGLFNTVTSTERGIWQEASDLIEHGVLSIRPHLDDMKRIQDVSQRSWLAKHVKHVAIYAGDFVENDFRRSSSDDLGQSVDLEEDNMPNMEGILDRVKANNRHCDPRILSEAFKNLPNLDSLSVRSTKYPFCSTDTSMHGAWFRMWNFDDLCLPPIDSRTAIARYRDVLVTASTNIQNPLRKLVLEGIPLDLFMVQEEHMGARGEPIASRNFEDRGVRDLRIRVSVSSEPIFGYFESSTTPPFGTGLAAFITAFQKLQSLDFSFDSDFIDSKRFRDRWQPEFYGNHFPHLKSLRLSDLKTPDNLLSSFILKHSATLKRLSIVRCTTEESRWIQEKDDEKEPWRSVQKLLTSFKDNLKLEEFQILCEDMSHRENELDDENQDDFDATLHVKLKTWRRKILDSQLSNAKLLEMFVIGLCPWPMAEESPNKYGNWERLPEYEAVESG